MATKDKATSGVRKLTPEQESFCLARIEQKLDLLIDLLLEEEQEEEKFSGDLSDYEIDPASPLEL